MVWFWNNSANKAVLAVISISSLPVRTLAEAVKLAAIGIDEA